MQALLAERAWVTIVEGDLVFEDRRAAAGVILGDGRTLQTATAVGPQVLYRELAAQHVERRSSGGPELGDLQI